MPPSTSTTSTPETLIFMASILDQRSPSTDRVFQTSIALSTSPSTTAIEPLPHLNYFLINQLIRLARPLLQKRRLKRFDYVADARKQFYTGHFKFLLAYRDLLDASACAALLDREAETLSRLLADALADARDKVPVASTRERLRTVEMQRRRNNEDMRVRLARLDAKAKRRRYAAAWYSDLKVVFLRDEVPWLIAVGRQRHEEAVARRAARQVSGPLQSPGPDVEGAVDGGDSDHCSDSGGTSTADGEVRDWGLDLDGNEVGGEGGML